MARPVKKLRVLAFMDADLVPPDDVAGLSAEEMEPWRTEHDVTSTLRAMGHEVAKVGLRDELWPLRAAARNWKPDVAFNILEEFQGETTYDYLAVSYLESMGVKCTGSNARGLILARDKGLSKKILSYHRIRTPDFAVVPRGRRPLRPRGLEFPLIVKSLVEEASLGISWSSVVDSEERLVERVEFIHDSVKTDALVERYIDGRELYVGVIGSERLRVLPPWELSFARRPAGTPFIATRSVKWNRAHQERLGVETGQAKLPEAAERRIGSVSRRAYRALGLSGYARLDFRLGMDGELYLLEVNPNPQIARGEDFAASAAAAGIGYERLLERILRVAMGPVRAGEGSARPATADAT